MEESVDVVDTAEEFRVDALSSLTATTLSGDEPLGLLADEEDLALYLLLLAGADSTGDLADDLSGFIIDGFDEGRLPRPDEIARIIIDPTPLRADGGGEGPRIEIITRPGTRQGAPRRCGPASARQVRPLTSRRSCRSGNALSTTGRACSTISSPGARRHVWPAVCDFHGGPEIGVSTQRPDIRLQLIRRHASSSSPARGA